MLRYSSFITCASCHAVSSVLFNRGVTCICSSPPPPCTWGNELKCSARRVFSWSILTPIFCSTGTTMPSGCSTSANNTCSTSICWWLYVSAMFFASCSASCAFRVNLSSLILLYLAFCFCQYTTTNILQLRSINNLWLQQKNVCVITPLGLKGRVVTFFHSENDPLYRTYGICI